LVQVSRKENEQDCIDYAVDTIKDLLTVIWNLRGSVNRLNAKHAKITKENETVEARVLNSYSVQLQKIKFISKKIRRDHTRGVAFGQYGKRLSLRKMFEMHEAFKNGEDDHHWELSIEDPSQRIFTALRTIEDAPFIASTGEIRKKVAKLTANLVTFISELFTQWEGALLETEERDNVLENMFPLPAGWAYIKNRSDNPKLDGKTFYYLEDDTLIEGRTQPEPPELNKGGSEDKGTGNPRSATWIRPLPLGWTKRVSEAGESKYYHEKKSKGTKHRPLVKDEGQQETLIALTQKHGIKKTRNTALAQLLGITGRRRLLSRSLSYNRAENEANRLLSSHFRRLFAHRDSAYQRDLLRRLRIRNQSNETQRNKNSS